MGNRLYSAISKIGFCKAIAKNCKDALRLLINTKRFSFSRKAYDPQEKATGYELSYKGLKEIYLRTNAGDISVFFEIFWLKMYQLPIDFSRFKVIVDAGANIGMSGLYFHTRSPQALIFAIEPDRANFHVLEKNIAQARPNFVPLCLALSNADGRASIRSSPLAYNITITQSDNSHAAVDTISMNSLVDKYTLAHIDLVKIDVEGYEHVIFQDHLDWLDKVDHLIIEIHSAIDHDVCMRALSEKGFSVKRLEASAKGLENIFWASREAGITA